MKKEVRRTKGRMLALMLAVCMLLGTLPAELFGGVAAVQAAASSAETYVKYDQGEWKNNTRTTTWDFTTNNTGHSSNVSIKANETLHNIICVSGSISMKSTQAEGLSLGKDSVIQIPMDADTETVAVTIVVNGNKTDRYYDIAGTKLYQKAPNTEALGCEGGDSATVSSAAFTGGYLQITVNGGECKTQKITIVETKKSITNPNITYAINVTDGTGAAEGTASTVTVKDSDSNEVAPEGAEITVTAAAAAEGMKFTGWTGTYSEGEETKNIEFADATQATTTFTMPAADVTLTTSYADASSFHTVTWTCDGGTAQTKDAAEGDTITITADKISGKRFTGWTVTSGSLTLSDASAETLTFTMPAGDVTLQAQYEEVTYKLVSKTEWNFTAEDFARMGISKAGEIKNPNIFEGIKSNKAQAKFDAKNDVTTTSVSVKSGTSIELPISASTAAVKVTIILAGGTNADRWIYMGPDAEHRKQIHQQDDADRAEGTDCFTSGVYSNAECYLKDEMFSKSSDGTYTLKIEGGSKESGKETKMASIVLEEYAEDDGNLPDLHTITATGGRADKSAIAAGATVNVTANAVPEGKQFAKWTGTDANGQAVSFAAADQATTSFTMPDADVTIEATYETVVVKYDITVTACTVTDADGVALTKAEAGTEVTVQANAAQSGEEFDKWKVEPDTVTVTNDATEAGKATFTMPESAVTIKAVYKAKTYALTVTNGKAANEAGEEITSPLPAGTKVTLTPDAAPADDQIFDKWVVESGDLTLTEEQAKTAGLTFTMPESAVAIKATYRVSASANKVTVTGGTASPEKAEPGTTITLKAGAAPEGKEFSKWEVKSGELTLTEEQAKKAETTFIMPATAVTIEATYKDITVVKPDTNTSSDVKDVQMDETNKPVFTNAAGEEVSGRIIIHAQTVVSTSAQAIAVKTKIDELIADVADEDKDKVQKLYYDISAYLNTVTDTNKVSMTGKVKIKFDYPEGVTKRNEIIALHGITDIKEAAVEKKDDCFWVEADGFSPYTIVIKPVAESSVTITREGGYEEGAFAEWEPVAGANGYRAYVSQSATEFPAKSIDNELLRQYEDHWRVDTVGLKAGTYYIKVEAVTVDSDTKEITPIGEAVTGALTVNGYDRTGFAFSKGSGSKYSGTGLGAYNNDGTLKQNAQVIYVTADTASSCKAMIHSNGANKDAVEVTGLQSILDAKQKSGTENDILDIRIIGCIKKADLDHISSSAEGLQIKGKANYSDMNITIEGIGEDAAVHGFGFLVRNCANVEFRNFAVMAFMDDGISLDTANSNIWIHDMDLFYGSTGGDKDQAKGDGSVDVKGKSTYITISYNHFWDSGKCSLCGMGDSEEFMVTYHHNWFDHSDSRHARVRVGSIHFYNNYYDGNSKYGVGVTKASSAFVEANYFRNCKYPMLISKQGSDIYPPAEGTFSGEPGGMIKAYNNIVVGPTRLIYANANAGVQGATGPRDNKQFDAYLASTRNETVDGDDYVTAYGGTPYNNFDTSYDLGVTAAQIDDPAEVPGIVTAKAGRLNGGDFKWTFTDADDTDYSVNKELKDKVVGYTSPVKSVGGINGVTSGSGSGGGGDYEGGNDDPDDGGDTGDGDEPILSKGTVHNFTTDGTASEYYKITGKMQSKPTTMTYGTLTLTKAMKMESSTSITFTARSSGTLILVQGSNKKTKVDGTKYTSDASGVLKVENLEAGAHEITKGDQTDLYYIAFLPDGTEDPDPPAEGSYKITVTSGTASKTSAKKGETITISASTVSGKEFVKWNVTSENVTLANEASATTTFTMPGAAVTVEATYKTADTPVVPDNPDDPTSGDFELNVGTDLANKDNRETFEKNGFTILAGAEEGPDSEGKIVGKQNVVVENNGVTVGGVKYTKRMKTGGEGTTDYRSIRFTTTDAATVTIVAVSSNSKQTRKMGISDGTLEDGKLVDFATKEVGGTASTYTFKLSEAGTYYIHSQAGGLNFYYIGVKYAKPGESGSRVDDEVREQAPDFAEGDLYVSTKGTNTAVGSFDDPMDLKTALESITPGHTIWMFSGTYYAYDMYEEPIIIEESNSGTADAMKKISSINGKRVTIDFDGMEELSSNRGITLDGSYWHFYDIDICNAGDNGMLLSGDHNKIELCQFYKNHDTGLQLSRFNTEYATKDLWPSYNMILNCTAFDNKDEATSENADGFAAKLTCGEGNVFDGCIAYCNSDDGWDLFAKEATGPIGQVTLRNCISFANGKLTDGTGSADGDMNGFKLGGSGVATDHIVENCLAFNNGATGFTDNNNPGSHTITNCTTVNNGKYDTTKANLMIYRAARTAQYTNLLSMVDSKGAATDQFQGVLNNSLYHYKDAKDGKDGSSYYWVNQYTFVGDKEKYTGSEHAQYTVTNDDFVNVTIPGYNAAKSTYTANYHEIFRNPDGSINVDGLFEVKKESPLYTAGKDGGYIGAKFSVDGAPQTYTVSVESGSASPVKAEAGATVTITADEVPGMEFTHWTVKTGSVTLASETSAETTFIMPASLVEIVAEYEKVQAPVYNIAITGGSATPTQAEAGTKVTITAAAAPEGKVFDRWVVKAGNITLADATSQTTTFTMGSALVELEATYKDASTTPTNPTEPTNPTDPTDPTNPDTPVTPGDSDDDDDDDDDDYEAPAPGNRTVTGDQSTVTDVEVIGSTVFTRPNGLQVLGNIIIHAEPGNPTKAILALVEEYIKTAKNPSKVIVQYYDIKAYEGSIDINNVVAMNGKVRIKFRYPAGVTRNSHEIIALHNTTPIAVDKRNDCFWITADGFSPYTIIYRPTDVQKSAVTGDSGAIQPGNAGAAGSGNSGAAQPGNSGAAKPGNAGAAADAANAANDLVIGGSAAAITTPQPQTGGNSGTIYVFVGIALLAAVAAMAYGIIVLRKKKED
ncbi:MAG: right-handed parallel beta-helix repeat-containing protein [Bacteroidales bacterium]|nr:right-handed parallel beta-helix repeat-containing protein [Lachnoclostridium sp.]MCM1383596.1 right-handed parallel beta-helix repeat-containing protein [Lachnoclostridium sp.]MCM1466383.1 right-handed parallel beta-helix repeat-containing protein [Bacteroidales bacterium]